MNADEHREADRRAHRHVILYLDDRRRRLVNRIPGKWREIRRKNFYTHHWKAKKP